jgi:hypothetical protein
MKQIIELTVPESWADITLKEYLALQTDLKAYVDDVEAQTAITIYHLCGLNAEQLHKISNEAFESLKKSLKSFMSETKYELYKTITINGIEYGFEPNLSQMSYGAFVDITKYDTITIDDNWANIMSILYRPIETKNKLWYSIQPYDGTIDKEKWLDVGMNIHFGCLFFFVNLLMDLQSSILNSMSKEVELHPNFKLILEESGEIIRQSLR